MAKEIAASEEAADSLGLTHEEKAFYDALTRPQAVKDFYSNDQLVQITKELTEALRKNRTIDWQKKESARAGMRKIVKRLLKKYNYPPEEAENALDIVIKQCEQWSDTDPEEYGDTASFVDGYNVREYDFEQNYYHMVAEPEVKYGSKTEE